jgi:hypothetical protein
MPTTNSPAEAALRKLLSDVHEAREWRECVTSVMVQSTPLNERPRLRWYLPESLDFLERLAREGLGEPAATGDGT